jgi:release factor glutamine methyltransferase
LLLAALDQWPHARGLGIDASEQALAYARTNAERLGIAHRAEFRIGDWTQGVARPFDLILANPPYIGTTEQLPAEVRDHEPGSALFAGPDGLDDYRRILPALSDLLAPGGAAIVEIGWTQAKAVSALALQHGLLPAVYNDLGERSRAVLLT